MNNNILLCGYFGHNNLGDDLLLLEALHKLPKIYHIYILSSNPDTNKALISFRKYRDFTIISGRKEIWRRHYKALIYSGGGLFPSKKFNGKDLRRLILQRLTAEHVIINGCGIVPKKTSFWFKLFLRTLSYCSVRDEVSRLYVESLGKKVVNCGDLYWGNASDTTNVTRDNRTFLICLANPFNKDELMQERIHKRYGLLISQLAAFITMIKRKGYIVHYLPFFQESDELFITDIQNKLNSSDLVLQRNIDYDLEQVDHLFACHGAGLCMRFHSILLALKNRMPMVAINYDYKSESLLQEIGLNDLGIRYGIRTSQFFGEEIDLDLPALYTAFDKMYSLREEYAVKVAEFYNLRKNSVSENYRKIFNLLT